MAKDDRGYLKAAFANVYNLSLLAGGLAVSAAMGEVVLGAAVVGAEALWLLFGPDLRPFRRAVDEARRAERTQAEEARLKTLTDGLPEREWARAHALSDLRREIERDMQQNPSFTAILIQPELDKLNQLYASFVTLASACVRAETYLGATDLRELERQIEQQRNVEQGSKDPEVAQIARKNIDVLRARQSTVVEIQNFLARARGHMNLIENTVRLLRDQVLTMASPDQLGEQLDDLLGGVAALQATAKDTEAIVARIDLSPIDDAVNPGAAQVRSRG